MYFTYYFWLTNDYCIPSKHLIIIVYYYLLMNNDIIILLLSVIGTINILGYYVYN